MNFYATPGYLDTLADVYFPGQVARVEEVCIGDAVLRLLVVGKHRAVTNALFLDYHEPIEPTQDHAGAARFAYAESVSQGTIDIAQWKADDAAGTELAPYVDWSQFRSFDAYKSLLMTRQKGMVRERERRRRRLVEQLGELTFLMNDNADDVLESARSWKRQQLRETGHSDFFADPRALLLLKRLRDKGLLTSSTLRARGRLLSVWVGFVHDGVWSGWVFAYDPSLRKFSVGHELLNSMLEESFQRGHREFDFSTGAEEYKLLYATHGRILKPIGRAPLEKRLLTQAKVFVRNRTPRLFEAARALRKSITLRLLESNLLRRYQNELGQ